MDFDIVVAIMVVVKFGRAKLQRAVSIIAVVVLVLYA